MTELIYDYRAAIEDIKAFLPNLVEGCKISAELFYEPVNDYTWQIFGELLQGLDDLFRASQSVLREIEETGSDARYSRIFASFVKELSDVFGRLNGSVDEEAYIEGGDCLRYEMTPLIEQLIVSLGEQEAVMAERFAVNLAYFQRVYPSVYDTLHKLEHDGRYRIEHARNGLPNLSVLHKEGNPVYYYSTYDPEYEAKRWVEYSGEKLQGKTNIVMYGFGLGYHVTQLLRAYPECRLNVYEPDAQVLLKAMQVIDFQELFTALNVVRFGVGGNRKHTEKMVFSFLDHAIGETGIITVPMAGQLDRAKQTEFSDIFVTVLHSYKLSMGGHKHIGKKWARNILNNASMVACTPSIEGLRNKLNHVTAVIVGSGPSLEADIECLREMKNHALIIAAGTAVQHLKHFGIEPHLLVCADGSDIQYETISKADNPAIPFLFVPQLEYRIIDNRPNLMHAHLDVDLISRYISARTQEDIVLQSTHSVTGLCIQAAALFGCKQIVFTGQDLSYPGEQLYAPGAAHISEAYNEWAIKESNWQVDNVNGTKNRTNDLMWVTLNDIEGTLLDFPEIRFINSSRWGAVIKHTEFIPLEDVLSQIRDVRLSNDFFLNAMNEHLIPHSENRIAEMVGRMETLEREMLNLDGMLKKLVRKIDELPKLSRTNFNKCQKMMEDIEEIWGEVVNGIPFLTLMATVVRIEIRTLDRGLPELVEEKNLIKKSSLFSSVLVPMIKAMQEVLPELNELVQEAINRMKLRMDSR